MLVFAADFIDNQNSVKVQIEGASVPFWLFWFKSMSR